jgi:hypothetical protein
MLSLALLTLALSSSASAQDIMGVWTMRQFKPDLRRYQPMCRGMGAGDNFPVEYQNDLSRSFDWKPFGIEYSYLTKIMQPGEPWTCMCLTPNDVNERAVRLCLGDPSFSDTSHAGGVAYLHMMEQRSDYFTTQTASVVVSLNGVGIPGLLTEQYTDPHKPASKNIRGMTFASLVYSGMPGTIMKSAPPRGEIMSARGWRSPAQGHPGHVAVGVWYAFTNIGEPGLLCRAYRVLSDIEPAAEIAAISKIGFEPQCLDLPCSVSGGVRSKGSFFVFVFFCFVFR